MIGGIALSFDQITGLEVDEPIGAGPYWLQVCWRLARISAFVGCEQVFGDDQAVCATCPERGWFLEANAHGKRVDLFDFHILVTADRCGGRCRVRRVFPVEHDIVGGEGLTVVPLHTCFQLPGYGHAVGSDPAVLGVRDFGGEHRNKVPVRIPGR
jgi:hypothetical protein